MSTVRRAYLYVVTLITLGIFSAGLVILLTLVLQLAVGSGPALVERPNFSRDQLSLGLSMLVIGGPLWLLFWRTVQRNVGNSQAEIGSGLRKLFLNIILTASSLVVLFAARDFLRWLLAGLPVTEFSANGTARLAVTVAIWYYHWRVSEAEGAPSPVARTLRRWYVYVLSGWGLVWLALGLIQIVNTLLRSLPVWGGTLVSGTVWTDSVQNSVVWVVLGVAFWYLHWFRMGRADAESNLRQVYLYLLTILGGSVAWLTMLIIALYRTINWGLGGVSATAGQHFQFVCWAAPGLVVTAALWSYHQRLAQEESAQLNELRFSARRIHVYMMTFLGLGTTIAGVIMVVGIFLGLLIDASTLQVTQSVGWWRSQLALSVAFLAVGTPVWLYYWSKALARSASLGVSEWSSRSRRIFLYLIVAAAIVALVADMVNIVYQALKGVLQSIDGSQVLRSSKWSLQSLVAAVPVLWYHWRIARQDQRQGAEAAAVRKSVTILIGDDGLGIVPRIQEKLGFEVHVLHDLRQTESQGPISDEDVVKLADEIRAAPSSKVLVVSRDGSLLVLPYREK